MNDAENCTVVSMVGNVDIRKVLQIMSEKLRGSVEVSHRDFKDAVVFAVRFEDGLKFQYTLPLNVFYQAKKFDEVFIAKMLLNELQENMILAMKRKYFKEEIN